MFNIPESVFNIPGIRVQLRAESVFKILRNTHERADAVSAADVVRTYKSLGHVEQAFRCMKGIDLRVRPIRHRNEGHVRAHIFLCMLAYYVEHQLRAALSTVLFQDDDLDAARWTRDPVARAEPSESARAKKRTKTTDDGWPVQSLRTVLSALGTRCKNTCRAATGKNVLRFEQLTETSPFQQHVFSLLGLTP